MPIFVPHAKLAALLGVTSVQSTANTLGELLTEIERRVGPKDWAWARRATLLINGRAAHHLGGLRARLDPEDQVWMVLPSAGG
jgi:hypothetical protein